MLLFFKNFKNVIVVIAFSRFLLIGLTRYFSGWHLYLAMNGNPDPSNREFWLGKPISDGVGQCISLLLSLHQPEMDAKSSDIFKSSEEKSKNVISRRKVLSGPRELLVVNWILLFGNLVRQTQMCCALMHFIFAVLTFK